jgi:hypothetical protein
LEGEGRDGANGPGYDEDGLEEAKNTGQMAVMKMSSAMKHQYIRQALATASVRLNRKKEREKFIPQDLTTLLNEKYMSINSAELPQSSN